MKIIYTHWEKRNLNRSAIEVIIDTDDNICQVIEKLSSLKCNYLVVKAPVGNFLLNQKLSEYGFVFVEHAITARNKLHEHNIPIIYKRLLKLMDYELITREKISVLYENLSQGIFKTDRIAVDPSFSLKIANQRYKNWINDELDKGSKLYFSLYKGDRAGFFLLQPSETNEVFSPLSGIFEQYKHLKLGFCLNCLIHNAAEKLGFRYVKTAFTSNNRGAFSIHASQSYTLLEQFYVYVKHIE